MYPKMDGRLHIPVENEQLAAFCRQHHIEKRPFFGPVLRNDFRPDSDVDVLVEFEKRHVRGLIALCGKERELSGLLNRKGDLNTPRFFRPSMRRQVLSEARAQYAP